MKKSIPNIISIFENSVKADPNKIAFIENDRRLSYGDLAEKVKNCCARYQSQDIKKGTKVLLLIPISVDLYINMLALFKLGAVIVFVDEWSNTQRIKNCISVVGIDVLVTTWKGRILRLFKRGLRRIPKVVVYRDRVSNKPIQPIPVSELDSALVTFTTGSTGKPKAANRTHKFLTAQYKEIYTILKAEQIEIMMTTLPIVVLIGLGMNKTIFLPKYNHKFPERTDYTMLSKAITQHKVDTVITSPFVLDSFSKVSQKITCVKTIYVGGAAIYPRNAQTWREMFSAAKIELIYGSTEVEPIATIGIDSFLAISGRQGGVCVGKVSEDLRLKIIRTDYKAGMKDYILQEGNIGEIIVAGDHVLSQYFGDETIMAKTKIREGKVLWHRTGDIGYMLDGLLYLVGRLSQMITIKGEKTGAFEIEEYLASFPNVIKGTAIQTKDNTLIILEGVVSELERREIVKKLGEVEVITNATIPMDKRHNSKVDYDQLKLLYAQ